jgi:hypothetical protein
VRALRGRKKKLIVAFHFHLSNPVGWNCEDCRKAGLESRRRCGWLAGVPAADARPVWARKDVFTVNCPKSVVDAESLGWLEEFTVRKRLGSGAIESLPAKTVDAFLILERLLAAERAALSPVRSANPNTYGREEHIRC